MFDATPSSTDDLMKVDMSFLDGYRRGGMDELKRLQKQEADKSGPEPEVESERPAEPESDEPEYERGGSGDQRAPAGGTQPEAKASQDATSEGIDVEPQVGETAAEVAESELDDQVSESVLEPRAEREAADIPGSLQLMDHQEAVQQAATKGGSAPGSAADEPLPQPGFRIEGVEKQPHIKSLPDSIMNALREQLRSAAVRERGVSDHAAREFAGRLGQGTLVTAFLLSQLDLNIETDAATRCAAELFRSRDPLLGAVVERMDRLEQREAERDKTLKMLRAELTEVSETSAVVEQVLAYSVADRTENFLRGSHNIHDAPITHKDAIFVRDRARELTRKQQKIERDRDGRPIR